MAPPKARHDPEGITPLEVIYSCSVCHETLSEIYAGRPESVGGLSDGINPTDRLVTRLYLASCCHVICIKHIGSGGPAFFKEGERPTAPCPICIKEKGDTQPRALYSVRGFNKGEYDPAIPGCWFETPPMKLEASGKEMEALRFHYISLVRYTKQVTALRMNEREELAATQQNYRNLEATAADQSAKMLALEQEVQRLASLEDRLSKYEKRMPEIRSHLQILPTLVEQNKAMKERLAMLGYSMLNQPIRYDKIPMDHGANILQDFPEPTPMSRCETMGSQAATSPSRFTNTVGSYHHSPSSLLRPQKRQRVESPYVEQNIHVPQHTGKNNAMPPPARPLSRMRSLKKFIPTIRGRTGTGRDAPSGVTERNGLQMSDASRWDDIGKPTRFAAGADRPPPLVEFIQRSPLSRSFQEAPPQSPLRQQVPRITEEEMNDDLYRPPTPAVSKPPHSLQTPHGLLRDPSYIRIMDGITPSSPDLSIRDPRQSQDFDHSRSEQAGSFAISQSPTKRWSLGHPFLHQSPNDPSSPTMKRVESFRTRAPSGRGMNIFSGPPPSYKIDPITPAPQRSSQQLTQVESVVSPFFSNKTRTTQPFSRAGITETSSRRPLPDTYPSQRTRMTIRAEPDWRNGKSLNGLSFIDSPLNVHNEPIQYGVSGSGYLRHKPTQQGRHVTSQGYIARPSSNRSRLANDSAYGSVNRSELHHLGVRSSYGQRPDLTSSPMRNLFSNAARRTVRR